MRSRRGEPDVGTPSEIVVDWVGLADGRPWRLERGVAFTGTVSALSVAARGAAAALGKRVIVLPDRHRSDDVVWVQFASGEIGVGQPCPCGARRLMRLSRSLVRCAACRSVLIVASRRRPTGESGPAISIAPTPSPGETLSDFSAIRLSRAEDGPDARRYVGIAIDGDGRSVLVAVREPLSGGVPIEDPGSPIGTVHEVTVAVPGRLQGAELSVDDDAWDLVVD